MTDKVTGGCLCGNVRFETAATPAAQVLCFCTDCQHISGSMCYTAYIVPLDTVVLLQGEPGRFDTPSDKGSINSRRFCTECGSRLWAELESGVASVNGMALDDRTHFRPTHNHRLGTAPDWCKVDQSLEDLPVSG